MAPFAPYLTDKIYLEINGKKESVHLDNWPKVENKLIDNKLEHNFNYIKLVIQKILSEREKLNLGTRWPLGKVTITCTKDALNSLKGLVDLIKNQTNLKEVIIKSDDSLLSSRGYNDFSVELDTSMTKELEEEGYYREVMRRIQDLRKKNSLKREDKINLNIFIDINLKNFEKEIKERAGVKILSHKNLVNGKIKDKDFEISFSLI